MIYFICSCGNHIKLGGEAKMISYKKLWKILIDKDMKKKDLVEAAIIEYVAGVGHPESLWLDSGGGEIGHPRR